MERPAAAHMESRCCLMKDAKALEERIVSSCKKAGAKYEPLLARCGFE